MSEYSNRLVSIPDAREKWLGGIGNTAFYALVNRGEVDLVKIGRRSFATTESLASYVERLKAASTPASRD